MLEIHEVTVTPFQQNCTLLVCSETGLASVCDCGDAEPVLARAKELGVTIESAVATHGHLDHIGGVSDLLRAVSVPFSFPSGDRFLLEGLPEQARLYGLPEPGIPQPDVDIQQAKEIRVGKETLLVRPCPGHTPGHLVFYHSAGEQMIAGDVLFSGSVGRTDLPGGSWEQLQASIREQIYTLPGATVVHCGHGPTTTIGHEATTNPFVRAGPSPH